MDEAKRLAVLRAALGLVYFWFGLLKLFPDLSSAETLVGQTLGAMGFDGPPRVLLTGLGIFECGIGACFLVGVRGRVFLGVFLFHMLGTFLALFVVPEFMFKVAPFVPNKDGQYVLKNLVLAAAGWVVLSQPVSARRSAHGSVDS